MFFFVKSFLAVIVVVVVPCGRRTLFRPFASSARLSPRVLPLNVIVLNVAVYRTDCSPISSVVLDFMCNDIAWSAFPGRDRCMAWDVHVQRVVWSLRRALVLSASFAVCFMQNEYSLARVWCYPSWFVFVVPYSIAEFPVHVGRRVFGIKKTSDFFWGELLNFSPCIHGMWCLARNFVWSKNKVAKAHQEITWQFLSWPS
jgi:hypothetical protein